MGGGGLWYRPRRHPKRPRGVSPLVCQPSGQDGPLACWAAERSRCAGRVPHGSPSYLPTLSSPAGFVFKAQTYRTCPAEHLSAFFFFPTTFSPAFFTGRKTCSHLWNGLPAGPPALVFCILGATGRGPRLPPGLLREARMSEPRTRPLGGLGVRLPLACPHVTLGACSWRRWKAAERPPPPKPALCPLGVAAPLRAQRSGGSEAHASDRDRLPG